MAQRNFDNFVKQEQQKWKASKQGDINWQERKAQWLGQIEDLYSQAKSFLEPYLEANQIGIRYKPIKLNEQYLGVYSTREMLISIGLKTVKLEPVGTLIVGSRGRVDVVGPTGRGVLVLLGKDVKHVSQLIHVSVGINGQAPAPPLSGKPESDTQLTWKIMSRPPRQAISELTRDTFLGLVMEVANG